METTELIRHLLKNYGENPDREGLLDTPSRVAKSYEFLMGGYTMDSSEIINSAVFSEDFNEMVLVKDIELYSLCEHHMLPFFGKCHIAYIPNGKIIGLSKLPRLVDMFSRRLQVQERLTMQIAGAIQEALKPDGVGVVIEAQHLCMMMRGVEKQRSLTTTSCMLGSFKEDMRTRSEFLTLLKTGTQIL
ncbi:MAG: GTP cyclohydrolase I FolE [Bacteroidetes bacterium]|nr:GTP cyclohydrolase I FolE [Bacteroidota bacterium]